MEFQLLTGSIELYYILKEKKTLFICSYLLSHIVDKYKNVCHFTHYVGILSFNHHQTFEKIVSQRTVVWPEKCLKCNLYVIKK